ncbi:MAG: exo-alpha-sialidase [Deltaproteobacteria bacterium]|nr:exo-alpha-sialidase [Deltaproteobacteria bacterium]
MGDKIIIKSSLIFSCLFLYLIPIILGSNKPVYEGYEFSAGEFKKELKETNISPHFSSCFIDDDTDENMVHIPSISEFSDGTLVSVWYGGSREGARDVSIYFSRGNKKGPYGYKWNTPRKIVTRESASKELKRYIKKIGNPVVFTDEQDGLWLIYVTVSIGGWSGSSLNVKYSPDMGSRWTESRRLTLSPLANISTLVRNRPVSLCGIDGEEKNNLYAIPIYHECIGKFSEILWFKILNKDGDFIYTKSRVTWGTSYIQPSIVPVSTKQAIALFRDCSIGHEVIMSESHESGRDWNAQHRTGISNPNSALCAIRLSDNRILMAFNNSRNNRENLSLAISRPDKPDWDILHVLENEESKEFSYPYMIYGNNGIIHMAYTFDRSRIKYITFNEAWLKKKAKTNNE